MSEFSHTSGNEDSRPDGSVARAVDNYLRGDSLELDRLVQAFYPQLMARARERLSKAPKLQAVTDVEGAVSSAFRTYLRGLKEGKFKATRHGTELLGLLLTMVHRKTSHQIRDNSTQIAGGGQVRNEPETGLDVVDDGPSPVELILKEEAVEGWRAHMRDEGLLEVAEMMLLGCEYREIARELSVSESKARRSITAVNKLTREFGKE